MFSIKQLFRLAWHGLADLWPALETAFNDDPDDDRLAEVYGRRPRLMIFLIAVAGVVAGWLVAQFAARFPLAGFVNWPAVLLAGTHALLLRQYLFRSGHARQGDFGWLAASLAPAVGLLMLFTAIPATYESSGAGGGVPMIRGILAGVTAGLAVAAAFVISLATLCFSRHWPKALQDLAVRLFVFLIMVWVTKLVLLDIGIVGPIVLGILRSITDLRFPEWLGPLIDALSHAGLMAVIYLALIGATWTVCRRQFAHLLATGDVDVLGDVVAMVQRPKRSKAGEGGSSQSGS